MGNDKAFAIYALALITAVASVLAAFVIVRPAAVPSAVIFIEHLLLGLGVRAAYKSLHGFDWSDWNFMGERSGSVVEPIPPPSAVIDATS